MKGFAHILLLAIMLFAGAMNRVAAFEGNHEGGLMDALHHETKAAEVSGVSGVSGISGVSGEVKAAKTHPKLFFKGMQAIADRMDQLSNEMAGMRQEMKHGNY